MNCLCNTAYFNLMGCPLHTVLPEPPPDPLDEINAKLDKILSILALDSKDRT